MSENKWTPGPWRIEEEHDGKPPHVTRYFWIGAQKGRAPVDNEWAILKEADAHLIAAAPAMAEALENILMRYVDMVNSGDCGHWDPETEIFVIEARAALSLARGEAK